MLTFSACFFLLILLLWDGFPLMVPMPALFHDVAKSTVLAFGRCCRVALVQLNVFEWVAQSATTTITYCDSAFHHDRRHFVHQFFGIGAMSAMLVLQFMT